MSLRHHANYETSSSFKRRTLAAVFLALYAFPTELLATQSKISRGRYENLLIGYDAATHILTGYYSDVHGAAGAPTCRFYFYGALETPLAHLTAFAPEQADVMIQGSIKTFLPGHIAIGLDTVPASCSQQTAFGGSTTHFDVTRAAQWREVRMVKSTTALIYSAPDRTAPTLSSALTQGDAVGITESSKGWLKLTNAAGETPVSGWVRETDLYSVPTSVLKGR